MRMFTQILVRTRVPPLSILRDVRAELVRVDREQQVMRVRDLQGWITNLQEYAQQQLVARLFAIFSMLALALSAVGLYSVVSYGVATRTNEFGIRMALGARARDVVRMVLSGTSWTVGIGSAGGRDPVRDLRQARLVLGDGELARSADPCRRHRPSSGRRRRRVCGAGAPRGVDRSDGRRAARVGQAQAFHVLSATIGSTWLARHAGPAAAMTAAPTKIATTNASPAEMSALTATTDDSQRPA